MSGKEIIKPENIQQRIFTLRDRQVMLDSDLAELYGVKTKVLNQAVKRNLERFPEEFMSHLTEKEYDLLRTQSINLVSDTLRSQIVTLKSKRGRHRKYLPYVFTEQGVAMLSTVLRSETAVNVSIRIMKAFVAMRRFLMTNAQVFQRLDQLELKQIETDRKVDKVLTAIEGKQIQPKQGIFFEGQVFDAYQFVANLVRSAEKSIVVIDNYADDTVLTFFSKRKKGVTLTILTQNISKQLELDIKKFNDQYPKVEVKEFFVSHDRFLIIDYREVYHIGASLKDLGKKWFAFSKMDSGTVKMLEHLKKENLI
ncbi:MAG: ORF6N domain-containing protein [Bacteroidota bacterium]|nr:ORF6N domain-containing protein [Bacteroidota bacterium]